MAIIDFHNHVYPPEYVDEIEKGPSAYSVTYDDDGNPVLHSPGDYNILVPGHRLMDVRKQVIDDAGIDKQVISFTAPGTLIETPDRSVELARRVNDIFADIQRSYPDQFPALATLPLNKPEACADEMERAVTELGLKGVCIFSNANGVAISDPCFWPMYERANELNVVFFVHPTFPVGVEAMEQYMLMPLVGFLMDTTLATASLVFSGVVERFPNLKWVLGHLGGAVPYLSERFDRVYEAFPQCRENITELPTTYLKEKFYYDTVNFDLNALEFAIKFAGIDHILAGSDYPHQIGSIPKMLSSLRALEISEEDRTAIMGGNAAQLLGL
ncbi:MAG: amidohydrolase [Candidatus Latescibacteria bacterium]|jgi:aminocarboxymuconate-semialdehyde decarboxylase|nr:amidohydrolase [Candidatus Latescibacterota bacterium]